MAGGARRAGIAGPCAKIVSVAAPEDRIARIARLTTWPGLLAELDRWRVLAARGTGKAKLSLQDVARASGVPRSTLATYLSGATTLPIDTLDAVVLALGASPEEARAWSAAWERATDATGTPAPPKPTATGGPAVRQLPADVAGFTGRGAALKELDRLLDGDRSTMVITAIAGTGGVGKTALAVHWSHRVADRFPDGQLYVNLRGYDRREPMTPAAALDLFLHALGVEAVPVDLEQRAARYRSELAGRQLLIVLDNARSADQVRPLLPGAPGCLVLVTSRNNLAGLVARDGAERLVLDRLTDVEAMDLLDRLLGPELAQREAAACAELARLCAGLPLALRVAAERVPLRGGADAFPALVGELADETRRLDLLDAEGDPLADVRAVFSWSYRALDAEQRDLLGLLGLAPGNDIGRPAAAALAGVAVPVAARLLDQLVGAHLVEEPGPGRYRMHDLVRLYAAERAERELPADRRDLALRRLLDFYLRTAVAADEVLEPNRARIELTPPVPGSNPLPFTERADALAWLETEYAALVAAQRWATERGWPELVWRLVWALDVVHWRWGLMQEVFTAWQAGLAAAEELSDTAARILGHRRLGTAYAHLNRYDEAVVELRRALELAEESGDLLGAGHTYHVLGRIHELRGEWELAITQDEQALRLFTEIGNPIRQAMALNAIGWFKAKLRRYDQARRDCETALDLFEQHGDPAGEASALDSLGYIAHETGRYADAAGFFERGARIVLDVGNTYQGADILEQLGTSLAALGRRDEAGSAWHRALELYRNQGRTADIDRVRARLDGVN
jgi:tetratricopeptide (TPR) repeat protein